jgi:hypothetical protein
LGTLFLVFANSPYCGAADPQKHQFKWKREYEDSM